MARPVDIVVIAKGTLTASTAVHVGGANASLVDDMPFARDGAGNLYIPGSSLAGPIRAWWGARFCEADRDRFFGPTLRKAAGPDAGHASYLTVRDAPAGGADREIRDGVAIDSVTGAAQHGFKYDQEVVTAGSTFDFELRLEIDDCLAKHKPEEKLATLLVALKAGLVRFGGAKTRGLGALGLELARVTRQARSTRDGMLAALGAAAGTTSAGPDGSSVEAFLGKAKGSPVPSGRMVIAIDWSARLPVLNLGSDRGAAVDSLPLVSGAGSQRSQTITGASVKGILKAHAARICRTMFPRQAASDDPTTDTDGAPKAPDAVPPLVAALFGSPARRGKAETAGDADEDREPSGRTRPGLGAVTVDDCQVADSAIGTAEWTRMLRAGADADKDMKVTAVQQQLDASAAFRDSGWRVAEHVAIDRWTGGAADNLLYNMAAPAAGQAGTFRIAIDWERIAVAEVADEERDRRAAIALLLLVLRDLARGLVPIGFGATRGFGSLDVRALRFEAVGGTFEALGLGGANLDAESIHSKEAFAKVTTIAEAWSQYCAAHAAGDAGS